MNWRRVDEVADTHAGGTPSRGVPEYFGGGIPWVKSGEVDGPPIHRTEETLSEDGLAASSAKWCPAGSSLVALYGATAGKVGRLAVRATTNQAVLCVAAKDVASADYLHVALASAVPSLLAHTQGSGQPNLNAGMVNRLLLPWPGPGLRDRISRVSHVLGKAEDLLRCLNASKQELKRGLMQELLTGNRRFPEFVSGRERQWSSFGRIPREWDLVRLHDVADRVTRRNADGETLVLTCSGRHGLVDQTEYFTKSVAADSLEGYYLLRHGEFAYNRSAMAGYPYGATKRLTGFPQGALSTLNICFAVREDAWYPSFAAQLFESGLLNRQLAQITRVGARAHGLLNVTKEDFFGMQVPVPPMREQEKIARTLDALNRELALLGELEENTHAVRNGVMQKLLSGEIDLADEPDAMESVYA